MRLADRLLTIVVTATLTSAAWIVVGGGWLTEQYGGGTSVASTDGARRPMAMQGGWVIPVQGVVATDLSDTFTDPRGEEGEEERTHQALDIMAPAGTPVQAAAAGRVEKLFTSRAGGLTIYIRSADGRMLHYYAHLQSYAPGLAEGQQVQAGQVVGTVGATGNADAAAPHLHFAVLRTTPDSEWWEPARAINPYPLLGGG
ncbi:M23 family metallopeptidase [Croceibacterium sp. TMG7-5b_MA50]|uniref:M23 family metallopeptidase n=1 Tax=Croceibacterium sp. TMG7-5b_MA50 TaxID=3121290 RepID=UPI0032214CD3